MGNQGQWANQQQWGQPQAQGANPAQQTYQQGQSVATTGVNGDPTQAQAGTQAGAQPDYSAAWALYYQQQQQYYQQYAMQQSAAVSAAPTSSAAAPAVSAQSSGDTSTSQAQVLAQYQAQL